MKTSGCFSKSRGLRASVPVFSLPYPLPSTVLLSPHFSRPECEKTPVSFEFCSLRTETLATQASRASTLLFRASNLPSNIEGKACVTNHVRAALEANGYTSAVICNILDINKKPPSDLRFLYQQNQFYVVFF